jgi:chloramphenicol-sensitive protein RarD
MNSQKGKESLAGIFNAVPAFLIWGLSPIYFKWLRAVPSFEILMHRMVWSFLFLIPIIAGLGYWSEFKSAISNLRTFGILLGTTLLVSCNWFLFIWAINTDRILETSLGYYINPLINVLFGMLFLKERLRRAQWVAVFLAGAGVAYSTIQFGTLPWISLVLALTFGFYGLIRKVAPVGALVGLTIETFIMSIPALIGLVYLNLKGEGAFSHFGISIDLLLSAASLVTALPLLLFTAGARRLHLSTIGILQYIAPSSTFLLAVFIYNEPFSTAKLWTFIMIWSALCIYSVDSILQYRKAGE